MAAMFSIGDGDTIRLVEGGRRITVRLACIDAPEMAQQGGDATGLVVGTDGFERPVVVAAHRQGYQWGGLPG